MVIFEIIMLICFGISWPISVYKSLKSKSTKGKSVIFLFAIILGYISGITGKIVNDQVTSLAFPFYILNLCIVSLDTIIYFINKKNENKQ